MSDKILKKNTKNIANNTELTTLVYESNRNVEIKIYEKCVKRFLAELNFCTLLVHNSFTVLDIMEK